jgi:ATP-dependent DNA ligase
MEAAVADELPTGGEWQYEPKWDGFRCLAFRDGREVHLQSKSGKPLTRYFPEVAEALLSVATRRFVLDGELVVPANGKISFDDLLLRIHPSATRVGRLAAATPASLIVFDLLADARGTNIAALPLRRRRARLEKLAARAFADVAGVELSPATTDPDQARAWFSASGGGLDGIIAKRLDLPYQSGERSGMVKMKHYRSADCVVGGFRYATGARHVGSLLLGLYDDDGLLHHVGFTSGIRLDQREAMTRRLEQLAQRRAKAKGFSGNAPGGPSRWATQRSTEWVPLPPRLVVEVSYDHVSGGRFRHGTGFLRWRPDKAPRQCTMDQIRSRDGSALDLLQP